MMYEKKIINLAHAIKNLKKGKIIAYPTESVFGLGCDPDNLFAIKNLLLLKNRSWKKGLILVAANYSQLLYYIDDTKLNKTQRKTIFKSWPGYITWTIPAKIAVPNLLTGMHYYIAVRISSYQPIIDLCLAFGKPIISSSANYTGQIPAMYINEIYKTIGIHYYSNNNLFIINGVVEGKEKPSEIRNAINGMIIRSG